MSKLIQSIWRNINKQETLNRLGSISAYLSAVEKHKERLITITRNKSSKEIQNVSNTELTWDLQLTFN